MSPDLAKPFINATKHVLSATAALEVVAGPPYVKKEQNRLRLCLCADRHHRRQKKGHFASLSTKIPPFT